MLTEILQFAQANQGLAFFLSLPLSGLILALILCTYTFAGRLFYSLPVLFFRHLNIRKHGWPTNNVNADGDVIVPQNNVNGANNETFDND